MSAHAIRLHLPGHVIEFEEDLTGEELVAWTSEPNVFNIWFRPGPPPMPAPPEETSEPSVRRKRWGRRASSA